MSDKTKRPRIAKGLLVASSNAVQYQCIRALTIVEYYRPNNYQRVKRIVI